MASTPLSPTLFRHHGPYIEAYELSSEPSISFQMEVWRRFRKNRLAVTGLWMLGFLLFLAFIGPYFSGYTYFETQLSEKNQAPSWQHWFGTDDLGRDVFTRVWYGARISLFVGVAAALIDAVIGVLWGSIAALSGGLVDIVMMRIADIFYALPYMLVVILLMVFMGSGLVPILIAMTLISWITIARIVRGQILQLKQQEFVLAATALGASSSRILFKHLLPNASGSIIVTMTLTVPSAIFVEAFLSFLGLGVQAPIASWGTMANEGLSSMVYYPWRLFFSAFFISMTIFSFNVIGDGLRDAFDPRLRRL